LYDYMKLVSYTKHLFEFTAFETSVLLF
jgi:hypothetical protein